MKAETLNEMAYSLQVFCILIEADKHFMNFNETPLIILQ